MMWRRLSTIPAGKDSKLQEPATFCCRRSALGQLFSCALKWQFVFLCLEVAIFKLDVFHGHRFRTLGSFTELSVDRVLHARSRPCSYPERIEINRMKPFGMAWRYRAQECLLRAYPKIGGLSRWHGTDTLDQCDGHETTSRTRFWNMVIKAFHVRLCHEWPNA
jgi:hypothetical protein